MARIRWIERRKLRWRLLDRRFLRRDLEQRQRWGQWPRLRRERSRLDRLLTIAADWHREHTLHQRVELIEHLPRGVERGWVLLWRSAVIHDGFLVIAAGPSPAARGQMVAQMSQRFYTSLPLAPGIVELTGAEAHHAATVCRLRAGDPVCLFNGDGH